MRLSEYDISRAEFHLGLNPTAEIPAGDLARFYEAVNRIKDAYWHDQLVEQINRCDRAWRASEVMRDVATTGIIAPSRLQTISGESNRTIQVSDPVNADRQYREVYLSEVDRLAESLCVPNYRREDVRRWAFARGGVEFIQAIPGPADTITVSRVGQELGMAWS